MRIITDDKKHNRIHLVVDDADDIWDLQSVLEPGDLVKSSVERKINLGGSEEKTRIIKKKVMVVVRVEKITYDAELRVLGPIVEGPDDIPRGSMQSIGIIPTTELSITKEWTNYQRTRIHEATKARSNLLVVLFDREHALLLSVTGRGIETLLKIKGTVNKKGVDEKVKDTFWKEIVVHTQEYVQKTKPAGVVFGSPAFWHEYVKAHIPKELAHAVFTTISDVERTAIKELIQRPELVHLLKENRATIELHYVEEIMTALAHEKLAYGDKDVKEAIQEGNIKTLFLSEKRIHKERENEKFGTTEKILRAAELAGGTVHIITSHDACETLDGLGGLVALKRW